MECSHVALKKHSGESYLASAVPLLLQMEKYILSAI